MPHTLSLVAKAHLEDHNHHLDGWVNNFPLTPGGVSLCTGSSYLSHTQILVSLRHHLVSRVTHFPFASSSWFSRTSPGESKHFQSSAQRLHTITSFSYRNAGSFWDTLMVESRPRSSFHLPLPASPDAGASFLEFGELVLSPLQRLVTECT